MEQIQGPLEGGEMEMTSHTGVVIPYFISHPSYAITPICNSVTYPSE
jgi:hypothetical protein